jgi:hypothetical protein
MEKPVTDSHHKPPPEEPPNGEEKYSTVKIESPVVVALQKVKDGWGNYSERSMIGLTFVIAVGAIFSVLYLSNQVQLQQVSMERQRIKDSTDIVRQDSINSLLMLAQKSRDSLSMASFILENRAYLSFAEITPMQFTVGSNAFFSWKVVNTGKTPAYRVRQMTAWNPTAYTDREFNSLKASADTGLVIGAGQPDTHISDNMFIKDSIALRQLKHGTVYVGIVVEYDDIFHITRKTRSYIMFRNDSLIYMRKFNDAN